MKIDEGKGRRKGEWGGKGQKEEPEVAYTHLPSFTYVKAVYTTAAGSIFGNTNSLAPSGGMVLRAVDAAGVGIVLLCPWHRVHRLLSCLASLSCLLKQLLLLAHAENQIPNKISLVLVTPLAGPEGYS